LIIYYFFYYSLGVQLDRPPRDHWTIDHYNPDLVQGPRPDQCSLLQLQIRAGHDGSAEQSQLIRVRSDIEPFIYLI